MSSVTGILCKNVNLGASREKPLACWFKLTTDAVVDTIDGLVGHGAVIRNHEGLVILAGIDQRGFL